MVETSYRRFDVLHHLAMGGGEGGLNLSIQNEFQKKFNEAFCVLNLVLVVVLVLESKGLYHPLNINTSVLLLIHLLFH